MGRRVYTVNVFDSTDRWCQVRISLMLDAWSDYVDEEKSNWSVQTEGFWRYRAGKCGKYKVIGHGDAAIMYHPPFGTPDYGSETELCLMFDDLNFGAVLRNFFGRFYGVNDDGVGEVRRNLCLGCRPGRITWTLG